MQTSAFSTNIQIMKSQITPTIYLFALSVCFNVCFQCVRFIQCVHFNVCLCVCVCVSFNVCEEQKENDFYHVHCHIQHISSIGSQKYLICLENAGGLLEKFLFLISGDFFFKRKKQILTLLFSLPGKD